MQHGELPLAAKEDLRVSPTPPTPIVVVSSSAFAFLELGRTRGGPRAEDGQSLGGAVVAPAPRGRRRDADVDTVPRELLPALASTGSACATAQPGPTSFDVSRAARGSRRPQ